MVLVIDGGAHVPYDSRLELARLLLADFDCSVEIIVAQPFQLVGAIGCKLCRHVPDFLLVRGDQTVTVVNVKTEVALEKAKLRRTFEWVTRVLSGRGWDHEVWTGSNSTFLANVRFLAGFRRAHYSVALLEAIEGGAPGRNFPEAELAVAPRWDRREVRAAILHLLWLHRLVADLDVPLSTRTVLEAPP
ncbi:TnsA-like heteromeric transposase endonuclease subunit [Rhodococcus sp. IC4_135]|nr:TnsA-like heteromeric transposase endonuclease subunit [Rhodococcus sp. IC4_135]